MTFLRSYARIEGRDQARPMKSRGGDARGGGSNRTPGRADQPGKPNGPTGSFVRSAPDADNPRGEPGVGLGGLRNGGIAMKWSTDA